jgi:hypothetical protein
LQDLPPVTKNQHVEGKIVNKKSLAVLCLAFIVGCQGSGPATSSLAEQELSVSVLSVNLRHIYNEPSARDGVSWRDRYSRVAEYVHGARDKPDVIVLQEAPGFFYGPGQTRIGDYAGIDFLIEKLRLATGEQYRIAYFISDTEGTGEGSGWMEQTSTYGVLTRGGKALLYRSSKIRNALAGGTSAPAFEYDVFGSTDTRLVRSMPCCDPGNTSADVCSLIDGPMRTYRCNKPSPSGLAWTKRQDTTAKGSTDAVFARLELVKHPGNYIHIYNVHLSHATIQTPNGPVKAPHPGINNVKALVNEMEQRYSTTGLNLYPPILVGDFNIEGQHIYLRNERETFFEQEFYPQNAFALSPDVIGVLIGSPTRFRSKQTPYLADATLVPWPWCAQGDTHGKPDLLWSDHCSIAFRVQPVP